MASNADDAAAAAAAVVVASLGTRRLPPVDAEAALGKVALLRSAKKWNRNLDWPSLPPRRKASPVREKDGGGERKR